MPGTMAAGRVVRLAGRLGTVHGGRAFDHMGNVLRGAFFGSALYRVSLRGRRIEALTFNPGDPWPGDPVRGEALSRGQYDFGGQMVGAADGFPWHAAGANPAWFEAAHGFVWLRDLEAVGTAAARSAARDGVAAWLDRCNGWDALAWRPDVLGRRIVAWLSHASCLLGDAEPDIRDRILDSLAAQVRHLSRTAAAGPDGAARFTALKGVLFGALCLPDDERRLAQGLRLLDRELDRQWLADGGHVERSPSAHFRVFQDLVELRAALAAADRLVPPSLSAAILRMAPMVRFYRHGDGGLALFNGSNEQNTAHIDAALGLGEASGAPPVSAPDSGFERLTARRTLVLVDVGAPPALVSKRTHAGPLSFELSVDSERLIVNCGAYAGDRPAWREAQRATAAHSTVTIGDLNAIEFLPSGRLGRRPRRVTCSRAEDAGNLWLDACHDGYRPCFGVIHRRRLYLAADGADMRGEDVLSGPGGKTFSVRFHLHPDVKASLVGDGAGALLRLRGGDGWRLRATGGAMQLVESIYLGRRGEVRRSEQVVVTGPLNGTKTTVKWAITRLGNDV